MSQVFPLHVEPLTMTEIDSYTALTFESFYRATFPGLVGSQPHWSPTSPTGGPRAGRDGKGVPAMASSQCACGTCCVVSSGADTRMLVELAAQAYGTPVRVAGAATLRRTGN